MAIEFWKKKVGGVPVIVFGVIGVGALIFVAVRTKATPEPLESAPDGLDESTLFADPAEGPAETGLGSGLVTNTGGFVASPGGYNVIPVTPSTVTVDTNDLWAKRAIEWLVQTGHAGGTKAQLAVQTYLSGDALSSDQAALVDLAIRQLGKPPEPSDVGPIGARSDPARKQGNPPVTHTVKGRSDNTYGALAVLYYGNAAADKIGLLQSRNTSRIGSNGPFAPGTKVYVPAYQPPHYFVTTKTTNTAGEIARKNGTSITVITTLNPKTHFPARAGTRVRVG